MAHVGDPRIAERAHEDRVELVAQHACAFGGRLMPVLRALGAARHFEVQGMPERVDCAPSTWSLRGHLDADAVTRDNSDCISHEIENGELRIENQVGKVIILFANPTR